MLTTTAATGTGTRLRALWATKVARGGVACSRCGELIVPGAPWASATMTTTRRSTGDRMTGAATGSAHATNASVPRQRASEILHGWIRWTLLTLVS